MTSEMSNQESPLDILDDDCLAIILSYLTIEDKIRLERVSRRWKNASFRHQNKLRLDGRDESFKKWTEVLNEEEEDMTCCCLNKIILKSVLVKCQFIESIEMFRIVNDEMTLETIGEFCSNLKSLEFGEGCEIDFSALVKFGQKFGSKLKRVIFRKMYVKNDIRIDKFLWHCVNLDEIKVNGIYVKQDEKFLPKLRRMTCYSFDSKEVKLFHLVSDRYHEQMKKISLAIYNLYKRESVQVLDELSRMKQLEELRLYVLKHQGTIDEEKLEQIGINCNKMKKFILEISPGSSSEKPCNVVKSFEKFKSLTSLALYLPDFGNINGNIDCFRFCKDNLKELFLHVPYMMDSFLNDIHIHLPNLYRLNIYFAAISDDSLAEIAKLQQLQYFELRPCEMQYFSDDGLICVITSCPRLREISLFECPNVTNKIIETSIVTFSEKKRRSDFKIKLYDCKLIKNVNESQLPDNVKVVIECNNHNAIN